MAKVILGFAALAATPVAMRAQDSPYKDQLEYEIANKAGAEKDPGKKLDLLKEWEQKYPDSKLASSRVLMKEGALLAITMSAYGKMDVPTIDASEKAGKQLVDSLDSAFSAANKPAQGVSDEQWAGAKKTYELQAHSSLAWDAFAKKTEDAVAEAEIKKVLTLDPTQAQMSYWMGVTIIRQKNLARYSEALYYLARAAVITGPNALTGAALKTDEDYLMKVYSGYHGDATGLDKVKEEAKAGGAFPPDGYHIKNVEEIQKEQFANEEEFNKAHPDIAFWRTLSKALKAPDGATYFGTVKDSEIPLAEIGMFKAKIVSVGDKEIVANVDNATGDVTLKFEKPLNQKLLNQGDAFQFKGVIDSYTADPYMLTLKIDDPKESIKDLPPAAFAAATAPAKKKPAPPKKKQ